MSTSTRIKDMPDRERPRERLVELGADGLRDAELIAILLRTGTKGTSAIRIAEVPFIPVRRRIAISSASDSAVGPFAASFSRGRSFAGWSLMRIGSAMRSV